MKVRWYRSRRSLRLLAATLFMLLVAASHSLSQDRAGQSVSSATPAAIVAPERPEPLEPRVVGPSDEGARALQSFRIAEGLIGNLFAAEPMVANPVAFYVDRTGRVFVCESFRQSNAVVDNRSYGEAWVDADLAAMTIEDRRQYFLRLLGSRAATFMEQDDRIRLLIDDDRDGVADASHVFAKGFNDLLDGTGAGVLEHYGDVFYTCIPSLYRLRDTDGDHVADSREVLHTGFGVRVAFRGHDMHGLIIGPDGRLYFSIGDRGANVKTPSGRLVNVESGSVFRCELDGSNLEIFATGMRNPQELAFDDFGNLFTGDNNSDSGDRARWVYVVEGGDSGWRMAYQYLRDRGPFNRERIWEPMNDEQPAYIVPPVANYADGPSGLDYYPGTGFGDAWQGRFVLVDFRGTPNQSGVRSMRNKPKGAFFELVDDEQPIWNVLATDVQFGPDGALYVSDWVNGWDGQGKGRIHRFQSAEHASSPLVAEVRSLLARDLSSASPAELAVQLAHVDRRVRQRAQLELAARRDLVTLLQTARGGPTLLARLHAIWGLGQVARAHEEAHDAIGECLLAIADDDEIEVRAHAIDQLGELGGDGVAADDVKRAVRVGLEDPSPRVQYFALRAVRRLADAGSLNRILAILEANAGVDPILRHGGIMALTTVARPDQLAGLSRHESEHVRIAAVVALRRLEHASVARFLADSNVRVAAEAARAIHDVPIPLAMEELAQRIESPTGDDEFTRRVLNANYRLGTRHHADALARFAANPNNSVAMRGEAIAMLSAWARPSGRDRVLGMWRPLEPRSARDAGEALRPVITSFADAPYQLRLEAGRMAAQQRIADGAPVLVSLLGDRRAAPDVRAEALVALAEFIDTSAAPQVEQSLQDRDATVRAAALSVVPRVLPERAEELLAKPAIEGAVEERQAAIIALASLASSESLPEALLTVVRQWASGELAPEVQLEAMMAAEATQSDARIAALIAEANAARDATPLGKYREALQGGNAERGRTLFFENLAISCVRCHKVGNRGGEVGPDLTRFPVDKNREYLLEAIVDPNKTIAQGFESVNLIDDSGRMFSGVLRGETEDQITLIDAEGEIHQFDKSKIDERSVGQSAMPEDAVTKITKSELRDLVEFLASLTGRRRFLRGR